MNAIAYDAAKMDRHNTDKLAAAIEEQREAVRAAAVAFAEGRGEAHATAKLSPFPVEAEAVIEAAAKLDTAMRRLSKLTFWLRRAEQEAADGGE